MTETQNGWNEYSKLVLKELETLAGEIKHLRQELSEVKTEISTLKQREDKIHELRAWKEKIDDVASPPQLQAALQDLDELKVFKTKAVTIFAVIQFGMAAAMWALKMMG